MTRAGVLALAALCLASCAKRRRREPRPAPERVAGTNQLEPDRRALAEELAVLDRELAAFETELPDKSELPHFLDEVSHHAEEHGVKVLRLEQQAVMGWGALLHVPFQIVVSGTYPAVVGFLSGFARPRMYRVERLELVPDRDGVKATVVFSIMERADNASPVVDAPGQLTVPGAAAPPQPSHGRDPFAATVPRPEQPLQVGPPSGDACPRLPVATRPRAVEGDSLTALVAARDQRLRYLTLLRGLGLGATPAALLDSLRAVLEPGSAQATPPWDPSRVMVEAYLERNCRFRIFARAGSSTDVGEFLRRLDASPHFEDVRLESSQPLNIKGSSLVRFVVTGAAHH